MLIGSDEGDHAISSEEHMVRFVECPQQYAKFIVPRCVDRDRQLVRIKFGQTLLVPSQKLQIRANRD